MSKREQTKQVISDLSEVCEAKISFNTKIKPSERLKMTSPKQVADYLFKIYAGIGHLEQKEIFSILLFDRGNKVLGWLKVSEGTSSACMVDIQYILRASILSNAQAIVLCHNHPSGNINPSKQDIEITTKVKNACSFMDIEVLDHVILVPEMGNYFSFADEGKI